MDGVMLLVAACTHTWLLGLSAAEIQTPVVKFHNSFIQCLVQTMKLTSLAAKALVYVAFAVD